MLIVSERERQKRPEVPRAVPPLHKSVGVCLETLLKHRAAAEQRFAIVRAAQNRRSRRARAGPFLRLNGTRVAAATRWTKAEVGEKSDGATFCLLIVAPSCRGGNPGRIRFAKGRASPGKWLAGFSTLRGNTGGCSDRGVSNFARFHSYVLTELACI